MGRLSVNALRFELELGYLLLRQSQQVGNCDFLHVRLCTVTTLLGLVMN